MKISGVLQVGGVSMLSPPSIPPTREAGGEAEWELCVISLWKTLSPTCHCLERRSAPASPFLSPCGRVWFLRCSSSSGRAAVLLGDGEAVQRQKEAKGVRGRGDGGQRELKGSRPPARGALTSWG